MLVSIYDERKMKEIKIFVFFVVRTTTIIFVDEKTLNERVRVRVLVKLPNTK